MTLEPVYEERVSSARTEALFVGLALLFLALFAARASVSGFGYLAAVLFVLFCFFLFYAINYRTLVIRISREALELRFGVFSWAVPRESIARGYPDDTTIWRVGGAGIHFTMIRRRYRVFFNFLEHPRVVLELTKARGFVRDVAFSTRRPDEVLDAVAVRARLGGRASPGR